MKPLDRTQLKAWHTYLDWEIAEAEEALEVPEGTGLEGQEVSEVKQGISGYRRVQILFERCLIACALYEEFWDKVSMSRWTWQGLFQCYTLSWLFSSFVL